jgi:hypothetical protein
MFAILLLVINLALAQSATHQLDKQLVAVSDLTNYTLKFYHNLKIYNLQHQMYKSNLGWFS